MVSVIDRLLITNHRCMEVLDCESIEEGPTNGKMDALPITFLSAEQCSHLLNAVAKYSAQSVGRLGYLNK